MLMRKTKSYHVPTRLTSNSIKKGNVWFRKLMERYRNAYCTAQKGQKSLLARNLCNYVRLNGGRFLEQFDDNAEHDHKVAHASTSTTSSSGNKKCDVLFRNTIWYECGDVRAHAKVGQTLREGIASIVRETLKRNLQDTIPSSLHYNNNIATKQPKIKGNNKTKKKQKTDIASVSRV